MIPIAEVAKGILRVGPLDTKSRTPITSPFLVVGERVAILEPGEAGQIPELLEAFKQLDIDRDRIDYAIASHIHLHHLGGVNVLLKELPKTKIVIHKFGVPYLMEPTRLNEGVRQVWGAGCPEISPVPQDRIWGVSGGEVIDLGGRELEIIETLGHSPHHISIFDRLTRSLFPGDAVGCFFGGPSTERPHPDIVAPLFDFEKAVDSLHRLRALKPSALFLFGYNGASFSPDQSMQWSENDITAVERICREGMKQKMSNKEISRRVQEYYESVGVPETGAREEYYRSPAVSAPTAEDRERSRSVQGGQGQFPMYAYLLKKDPSLEMPK
ncbi:MBL fold metallo-hydrolase [Chloroflexota bacterium]